MMGHQVEQKDLFSYSVDLDKRIRPENPLRGVSERIDFTFAREEVKEFYGYNGNESVDPVGVSPASRFTRERSLRLATGAC